MITSPGGCAGHAPPTTAATTGLLDWRTHTWAHDLLARLGLDAALLPDLHDVGTQIGVVSADAAVATGIPTRPCCKASAISARRPPASTQRSRS